MSDTRTAVVEAVHALNKCDSASTRTHIHKLMYFWHRFLGDETDARFVLHHHGPYSFEVDRAILDLEAFNRLRVTKDPQGFGARYEVEEEAAIDQHHRAVAEWLSPKTGRQLEALATVDFMSEVRNESDPVAAVIAVKPHLNKAEVEQAKVELGARRAEFAR